MTFPQHPACTVVGCHTHMQTSVRGTDVCLRLDIEQAFDYPLGVTHPQHPVLFETALAGTESLRPLLQDGRIAPGHYIVSGPRDLPGRFLTTLCPALLSGTRVLWLDAGNSFNAYGLGYASRFFGANARTALAREMAARY